MSNFDSAGGRRHFQARLATIALFFVSLNTGAEVPRTVSMNQILGETNAREKYLHGDSRPNHATYQIMLTYLLAAAESDQDRGLRIIAKRFGGTSRERAEAILQQLRELDAELRREKHALTRKMLCGRGSLRSRDHYYRQLDARDDALIGHRQKVFAEFVANLEDSEASAFADFVESRSTAGTYLLLEHKSSYEASGEDVQRVIQALCERLGESP